MRNQLYKILFTTIILSLVYHSVNAQYVLNEADKQYALGNYNQAVMLYNQAWQKKKSPDAMQQLANSYRELHDYKQAESWYAKLAALTDPTPEHVFFYAQALRNNSKYNEAKVQYLRYADLDKTISKDKLAIYLSSCDSAVVWMSAPKPISLKNEVALNSEQSDWAAYTYRDQVIFTSDREQHDTRKNGPILRFDNRDFINKDKYGRTGNPYQRLYVAISETIKPLTVDGASALHVGPATISTDGTELFYTITRELSKQERKKIKDKKIISLNTEIYAARLIDGQWKTGSAFPHNNITEWSTGDPFLSSDGKQLYFVSNKPGGLGGTDIYRCTKEAGGQWGEAINLGAGINTAGNERTPVISVKNELYFSSDGLIGMGGLDVYKASLKNGKPINLGYPINSPQDDLAFNFQEANKGYLSSDREGGKGSDDIYSFVLQQKIKLLLTGTVQHKNTKALLNDAIVSLKDQTTGTEFRTQTDSKGHYQLVLDSALVYDIAAEKTNFRKIYGEPINTKGLTGVKTITRDLLLEPITLNTEIRINNILYDFDQWTIRTDAHSELDKLVQVMKNNPTLRIELGSHTDSRGDMAYNKKLSQRRANLW
jgi:peptidoglycan-associated lipoprotein